MRRRLLVALLPLCAGVLVAVGCTGPAGLTGATGAQGQMGMTGAQGSSGLTGLQGSPGMTGAQGSRRDDRGARLGWDDGGPRPGRTDGGPGRGGVTGAAAGDSLELVESVHVRLRQGGHPVFGVEEARRDRGLREPEPVRATRDRRLHGFAQHQSVQSPLSQRRVATVRDALIQAGVPADRIETGTFGTDRPMCNPSTEQCSPREGRVEVLVRASN